MPEPPSPRKYWTRHGIAEWLVDTLAEDAPTLVGIDHGFSFPLRYFEAHGLVPDWPTFLDDFQRHWPTDEDNTYVREGATGNGAARLGNARWRRLTEVRAGSAKSVFHFDVQWIGGEIDPRRDSLAAFHPRASWHARPFLAVRRPGHSRWALSHNRGLSCAVEPLLRPRGP